MENVLQEDPEAELVVSATFGQRMADNIAAVGGSWRFLGLFGAVLVVWIGSNSLVFLAWRFDPYPFILLNLVLSCLAAVQAPVIMMSQRRQEARDRARAVLAYRVNLKAEEEIRNLHRKIDNLLIHQSERLAEIQRLQMELLKEAFDGHAAPRQGPPPQPR